MKRIFAFLAIATIFNTVYAKDIKLLLELGGSYSKKKRTSYLNSSQPNSLHDSKISNLNIQLGYQIAPKSYVGLSYQHNKGKALERAESFVNNEYFSLSLSQMDVKIDSYSLFYRYYIFPLDVKRWNVFTELATGLEYQKRHDLSARYITTSQGPELNYDNHLSRDRKSSALDADLRIGGSYRISQNFLVQLSLHSVGNVNHNLKDSWESGLMKKTTYQLFKSPLSNTYLSILFKI